jgi:hypothetical protein
MSSAVRAPTDAARTAELMRAKYGLEYRVFRVVEPLVRRGRNPPRVALRIVPADVA